jgi:DNA-binding transcriptional ArsR family regulator
VRWRSLRSRSDVFAALADPSRRFIVEALAERTDATATELASELPVTRQAVTKHLGALADAGLIAGARAGRETRYRLTPGPLADAAEWMTRVGAEWDERLGALARSVKKSPP